MFSHVWPFSRDTVFIGLIWGNLKLPNTAGSAQIPRCLAKRQRTTGVHHFSVIMGNTHLGISNTSISFRRTNSRSTFPTIAGSYQQQWSSSTDKTLERKQQYHSAVLELTLAGEGSSSNEATVCAGGVLVGPQGCIAACTLHTIPTSLLGYASAHLPP